MPCASKSQIKAVTQISGLYLTALIHLFFSPFAYKLRNRVERFFIKLKNYRAIATRFDRHDANFMASIKLAAIRIWMRFNESVARISKRKYNA